MTTFRRRSSITPIFLISLFSIFYSPLASSIAAAETKLGRVVAVIDERSGRCKVDLGSKDGARIGDILRVYDPRSMKQALKQDATLCMDELRITEVSPQEAECVSVKPNIVHDIPTGYLVGISFSERKSTASDSKLPAKSAPSSVAARSSQGSDKSLRRSRLDDGKLLRRSRLDDSGLLRKLREGGVSVLSTTRTSQSTSFLLASIMTRADARKSMQNWDESLTSNRKKMFQYTVLVRTS